jgi:four helix bundle protein
MFNHQKLRCYAMALEVAKRVPSLVSRWPRGTGNLEDQMRRAVISVVLNISDGNARMGAKERARFFAIARASASEVASCIDIAEALRLIDESETFFFNDRLLQIVKMLYKLR